MNKILFDDDDDSDVLLKQFTNLSSCLESNTNTISSLEKTIENLYEEKKQLVDEKKILLDEKKCLENILEEKEKYIKCLQNYILKLIA